MGMQVKIKGTMWKIIIKSFTFKKQVQIAPNLNRSMRAGKGYSVLPHLCGFPNLTLSGPTCSMLSNIFQGILRLVKEYRRKRRDASAIIDNRDFFWRVDDLS